MPVQTVPSDGFEPLDAVVPFEALHAGAAGSVTA